MTSQGDLLSRETGGKLKKKAKKKIPFQNVIIFLIILLLYPNHSLYYNDHSIYFLLLTSFATTTAF